MRLVNIAVILCMLSGVMNIAQADDPFFRCQYCDRTVYVKNAELVTVTKDTGGGCIADFPGSEEKTFYIYKCPYCGGPNKVEPYWIHTSSSEEGSKSCVSTLGWVALTILLLALVAPLFE